MNLIPEVPSSPKLIKSDSMSSVNSDSSEEAIIDAILNDLIDDVCTSLSYKRKMVYRYVKIKKQALLYAIINYLYFIFTAINLVKFKKIYQVNGVYCIVDKQPLKMKVDNVHVCDNCVQLNRLKIPYEYIKLIHNKENKVQLSLIPNERNVNQILIDTKKQDNMYKKLYSNMNYHMRYHKLDNNAIKYYQKFQPTPIETYA